MENKITEARLDKYLKLTENALRKARIAKGLTKKELKAAEEYKLMAKSYHHDSKHFKAEGNWVNAFAAINYAHAWLDAGAMQGLFDVGKDNKLFTVDSD